jgi:hypothetical protein
VCQKLTFIGREGALMKQEARYAAFLRPTGAAGRRSEASERLWVELSRAGAAQP